MKIPYTKPALTFKEQIAQLKSRGLIIEDETVAFQTLNHISYYRLSAFIYPFLSDKSNHIFKEDTRFNDIINLYNFDRELRILLLDAVERIEISLRTNIIYVLSHKYGAFWVSNKELFYNSVQYEKDLLKLSEELNRSDERFLKHFFNKYSDSIPPAWISFEITSFGLLSLFFKNLKSYKDQKEIANRYGLNHIVFSSWFHSLTYIRNVCAHHARIWNRELAIQPTIPKSISGLWLQNTNELKNDRLFIMLSIILYFLNIIEPDNHFKQSFNNLLTKFPIIDLAAMGFPKDWKHEKLFN
ncbi:MAG: Abi family protein [Ignavibacteriaceae bacterium]